MPIEWFRCKTWTSADREQFFARLRPTRTVEKKAQYLRVQAVELLTTGTAEGAEAARELVEVLLKDYAIPFELAQAYLIKGECLERARDLPGAIAVYRQSLEAQRVYPNVRTTAPLAFGWLVATHPFPEHYEEPLRVLDEFEDSAFPLSRYRTYGARALINDALGRDSAAKKWAALALDAASAQHSGFRYHPRLGLVENPDERIRARLRELAGI